MARDRHVGYGRLNLHIQRKLDNNIIINQCIIIKISRFRRKSNIYHINHKFSFILNNIKSSIRNIYTKHVTDSMLLRKSRLITSLEIEIKITLTAWEEGNGQS